MRLNCVVILALFAWCMVPVFSWDASSPWFAGFWAVSCYLGLADFFAVLVVVEARADPERSPRWILARVAAMWAIAPILLPYAAAYGLLYGAPNSARVTEGE